MTALFKSSDLDGAGISASPGVDEDALYLKVVSSHSSLFSPFLSSSEETGGWPALILDGANGSELERMAGAPLHPTLWSAACVTTEQGRREVKAMHWAYLNAGADCITAVSYQASIAGFQSALQVEREEAARWLRLTVELAVEARDEWWQQHSHHQLRERPLVAASIGSFGALLADGEEYTGNYHSVSMEEVEAVQRERVQCVLSVPGVDLLLLETLPNFDELRALLSTTLPETCPLFPIAVSLSCKDGQSMPDGTPLSTAFAFVLDHVAASSEPLSLSFLHSPRTAELDSPSALVGSPVVFPSVVAFGVNCIAPEHGEAAMRLARSCLLTRWLELTETVSPGSNPPSLPLLLLYCNSGEDWDPQARTWTGRRRLEEGSISPLVLSWYEAGARIVGGCCRTSPAFIHEVRRILLSREFDGEEEEVEQARMVEQRQAIQPHL